MDKAIWLLKTQIEFVRWRIKQAIPTGLKWTGSHVELVELLYALHEAGSINGGKITLKEIVDGFCSLFEIDLKNFSRSFANIKNRMKGDRTVFLDKLKRVLIAKMEAADRRPARK